MRNRFLLSGWVLALAQVFASAQIAQPSQPPSTASAPSTSENSVPEFRVRSEVVLVPVVVLGKHDEHISGLTKDAFRLEENGKEQTIASLEERRPEPIAAAPAQAPDQGYSNLPLDLARQPRLTILVLDLFNSSSLQRTDAKELLIKFLSNDLRGDEPISVVCLTNKGVRLLQPFTSDRSELIRSLQSLDTAGSPIGGYQDAARITLEQIRYIAWAYAGVLGRKSMILASGNIPYPTLGGRIAGESDIETRTEFDDTRKSLLSANIAVYPVGLFATSLDPTKFEQRNTQTMESLHYFADATGGGVCLESNGLSKCLNQAVEDSRSYYMLTYSVKPDDRKPGWRDLKVKVNGVDASVRARSGFYYEDHSAPVAPDKNHKEEIDALASPLSASAVQMNVRVLQPATPSSPTPPGGKTTVQFVVTVPFSAINVDSSRTNSVDLEFGAIALDKQVHEAGEFLRPLQGNPKPEAIAVLAREGIKLRQKLDLPAGTYDMRFFVRDNATGQIGTVVFPLDVK